MCEKGVNTEQLGVMIAQIDDSLALAQQWLEQIHHLADRAGLHDPSVLVAQSSVLVGETRLKLQGALDTMDSMGAAEVTIERI